MLVCQQTTMSNPYQDACRGPRGSNKAFSSSVAPDDIEASLHCIPSNNDLYTNTSRLESSSNLHHVDAEEDEVDQRIDDPTESQEVATIDHCLESSLEVLQTSPFSDPLMRKHISSSAEEAVDDDNALHGIVDNITIAEKNTGSSNRVYSLHEKCCSKDEHCRLKMFNNYRDSEKRESSNSLTTMVANDTPSIEEQLLEFKSFWASL